MRTNLFDRLITIILLFVATFATAQISVNTNFNALTNQPIDTRDTLTNLADTSDVDWKYPGLLTYAVDSSQWWFYDGAYWQQLVIPTSGDFVTLLMLLQ